MRQNLAQTLDLLGVSSARDRAHSAVTVHSGQLLAPILAHIAHKLVYRRSRDGSVLKLSARRVGGLDKHEDPLVVLLAYLKQRLYAVGAEVAVYRERVAEKRLVFLIAHFDLAEMRGGIRLHSRAYIVALCVGDDEHSL